MIVAPEPQDDRQSALIQYDLGQAHGMHDGRRGRPGRRHVVMLRPPIMNQAKAVLGFPRDDSGPTTLRRLPVDKPLAVIERLDRRPFDEVVHRERW